MINLELFHKWNGRVEKAINLYFKNDDILFYYIIILFPFLLLLILN